MIYKLFREPLLWFLIIGGTIFWGYGRFGDSGEGADPQSKIIISRGQQESLLLGFEKTWNRKPTEAEIRSLIDGYVREEVLYREALAMGLDDDDPIIRRRLGQKMVFLSEDLAALTDPGDKVLQAYLTGNPEAYRQQSKISFRQIFFDVTSPGAMERARDLLAELQLQESILDEQGDGLMLPSRFEQASEFEISRTFGSAFLRGLMSVPVGSWQGPVESGFGVHLVYIEELVEGRAPELAEVRGQVYRDWSAQKREEYNAAFYDAVRQNYDVVIESSAASESGDSITGSIQN